MLDKAYKSKKEFKKVKRIKRKKLNFQKLKERKFTSKEKIIKTSI